MANSTMNDTVQDLKRMYSDEKKTYTKRQRIGFVIKHALVIMTIGFACWTFSEVDFTSTFSRFLLMVNVFPTMLLGSVYGLVTGMIAFSVIFVFEVLLNPAQAFSTFFYMMAILLGAFFCSEYFYKNKKRVFLSFLISGILFGVTGYVVFSLVGRRAFTEFDFSALVDSVGTILPQTFLYTGLTYALNRFVVSKHKDLFPSDVQTYHMENWISDLQIGERKNKRSISGKIAALITVEALTLGVCAAIFANMLIPSIGAVISDEDGNLIEISEFEPDNLETIHETEISDEEREDIISHILGTFSIGEDEDGKRFLLNNNGLAFDLKLIMMLMNVTVPLVVFFNLYAQRSIANPILVMSETMREFSKTEGDEREKNLLVIDEIKIQTKDEIQELYQSLQKTSHEIVEYIDRMKEEQKLEEELRVAQKSSEAKSSFLSNMSHEIRTPINAVLGLDEMILRECDDKNILKYANDIQSSGKTLLSLVNDILDFSKIEAGKMEILPVDYQLSSVINDLINMISIKAQQKDLELKVNVAPDIPHNLFGDEIRIKQCVTNILTNAVKYTEAGTVTLNVSSKKVDDENILLQLQVLDTGIGIKEEDLKKLYSPFERIEETRNRTIEGTGLGMSIVKQLLAMMDSQLVVKSVYGEGSDFSFEIKQKVLSWEPIGNFNEAYERSLENNRKYKERFRAPDARILITDDTRMNLTVACGLLKRTLIRIDTAESGKQTLEMVQKQKYDVIFLDHRMPEMDGVETLQAMRALGEYINADTPVIALTANAVSGAREFYLEAGFADYFTKPIDGVKLEKLLQDYIPADKIRDTSEEEQSAESGSTEPAGTDESSGEGEEDVLANLPGIDYKAAMANCVTREILESAMKDYLAGISETADKIRDFAEKEDVRNYTVLVHALKSSSRLIGALHLSEAAAYLEKCGDEGNLAEIREKTPALLEEYRGYAQVLGFLEDSGEEDEDKPLIDPDQLKEAYAGLKEFVSAFDFDSADAIINMLNDYRVAPEEKEHFNEVKKRLTNVDRDGLLEIL